jgi:hypothetical protein
MNYSYNPYQNYGMYQQPSYQSQQMTQPQMVQNQQYMQPTNTSPINDIKFVTADEAKAYIVMPNTKVMLMDRDKSVFYIKSADSLGKSTLEGYKYTPLDNTPSESVSPVLDPKDFVKTQDLDNYLTKDDLANFLTRNDAQNFITRDDFKSIDAKLDKLQKQIVGDMLKGDGRNGKQPNNY